MIDRKSFHLGLSLSVAVLLPATVTVRTQSNHFFASIYAFFKLEQLKLKHHLNHFALRNYRWSMELAIN